MPQMFPMNWMILFTFFTLIFIFMNILNYYNMMIFKKKNNKNFMYFKTSKNNLNWKW